MWNLIKNQKVLLISGYVIGTILAVVVVILSIKILFKPNNVQSSSIASNDNVPNNSVIVEENSEDIYVEDLLTDEIIEEVEEENSDDDNEEDNNGYVADITSNTSYYVMVNYQANTITVYSKNDDGSYSPIKAITCSTGRATPRSGVYPLKSKREWWQLMGGVWGHYTSHITGNILFHSVPYMSADPSTLEYWEYDKLGTAASAGCVRLTTADAKWIFENIPSGTPIEFYASSDPGPLGKPGTIKISWNTECRGWDPTDTNPNNPWKNQMPEVETEPDVEVSEQPQQSVPQSNNSSTVISTPSNSSSQVKENTVPNNNSNNNNTQDNSGQQEQSSNHDENNTTNQENESNDETQEQNDTENEENTDTPSNNENDGENQETQD